MRGIVRTESGDLLAVLDELHTHTLADGRVGLLGLDTDLLEDDTLGVGRALISCQPPSCAHPRIHSIDCPSCSFPSLHTSAVSVDPGCRLIRTPKGEDL